MAEEVKGCFLTFESDIGSRRVPIVSWDKFMIPVHYNEGCEDKRNDSIRGYKAVSVTDAFGDELVFDIIIYNYKTTVSKAIALQELIDEVCDGSEFDETYVVVEFSLENFIDEVSDGSQFMEDYDLKVVRQLMEEIVKTLN